MKLRFAGLAEAAQDEQADAGRRLAALLALHEAGEDSRTDAASEAIAKLLEYYMQQTKAALAWWREHGEKK